MSGPKNVAHDAVVERESALRWRADYILRKGTGLEPGIEDKAIAILNDPFTTNEIARDVGGWLIAWADAHVGSTYEEKIRPEVNRIVLAHPYWFTDDAVTRTVLRAATS